MHFSLKKKIAAAATVVALVGGAGLAYAYWTNTGTGNGTATTGTNTGITVNQTNADIAGGLVPGGPVQPLSGTFTNTNSSPVHVAQVTVGITAGFSVQADALKPPCTAADYALIQPTATNAEVVTGSTWTGASIALLDGAGNQDNCKTVVVPLTYSSN